MIAYPSGVAVDNAGNIYVADWNNNRVREVSPVFNSLTDFILSGLIPIADPNGLGYFMTASGYHQKTINLETGVVLYDFNYDQNSNLSAFTDQFGNQTVIERDFNGVPTAIVSPDGLRTELTVDANNHLTNIIYPDGSSYVFEYTADGLMTVEVEPNGNRFEHIFDSGGKLTNVLDQEGGNWHYDRTIIQETGDVVLDATTGEGNLSTITDYTFSTGAFSSTITDPFGAQTVYELSADSLTDSTSLPCGMEITTRYDLDPKYKFKAAKETTITSPAGLTRFTQSEKIYQDTDADDIPDLITQTVTRNGKATSLVHNVLQTQNTVASPQGRTVTSLYDPKTLLTLSVTVPGLYASTFGYDDRGRLTSAVTGDRTTSYTYNAQGFLESVIDPENFTTSYSYDPVGRVTSILRPDDSSANFTYDANGNMTMLVTPSAIDHGFGYNTVNLNTSYQTPLSGTYSYVYDKDRRLSQINFP
ncbi:MAG: hypothetical protein KAS59_09895, partial [Alphaproteobacteria bacterium]|nr:hypothetical protein [Alphaproteobacteria bacterium]